MAEARVIHTDRKIVHKLLPTLHARTTPGAYRFQMVRLGRELADDFLVQQKPDVTNFHIVAAVEDFDGLAMGVMQRLRKQEGIVTYSCIWPRPQTLSERPLIEICAIDQAFHQNPPTEPFQLVFVAANVGSVAALKAMMLQTIADRNYDAGKPLEILSPVAHSEAEEALKTVSPERWRNRIHWTVFASDLEKTHEGFTSPCVGGPPSAMAGLLSPNGREGFIPSTVREDFNFPLDPGPDPQPSQRRNRDNGGSTPNFGR